MACAACSVDNKTNVNGQGIQFSESVISVHAYYGREIQHFFYDLKENPGSVGTSDVAEQLFDDDDMDGVRIPIYGDNTHPAHPSYGTIEGQYYADMLNSIERAKKARGDRGLIIFASKKLDGKTSFPDWVKDANGVIPEKYGKMLVDYIQFLRDKGIVIDVLGIDNESNFNEGMISPQKHKLIVDYLKMQSVKLGFKMPLVIGPERFEPMGNVENSWLKILYENNWESSIDIYGTHYYPQHRYSDRLQYELSLKGDKPFWSTELHWPSEKVQTDVLDYAETVICTLWDQTDLGMDAFMWWDYKPGDSLRGCLMSAVSVPLHGSRPIMMTDVDGSDIKTDGTFKTRAFRNNKTGMIYVYVINMSGSNEYNDYRFTITDGMIENEVNFTLWRDGTPVSGISSTSKVLSPQSFMQTIPSRSITVFKFKIK